MAGEIRNLEIFAAGTHNASTGRVTITEKHLDEIVENFDAFQGSNIVKPHLKFGHTDAQKWFGQDKGTPALGWITKVWREGKKILANVSDVPDALLNLIKAHRYHNVSAEVYPPGSIQKDGKGVGHVLSAVALLGAEMPAVKDLAGLAAALFDEAREKPVAFAEATPTTIQLSSENFMFSQEQVDALIQAAVDKAVNGVKSEFSSQIDSLKSELKVATERAEAAETSLIKAQESAANAQATALVDQAIKDGKLLPKQREFALAFCTQKGMIKFGDGEKSPAQLFQDFLANAGTAVQTKEQGRSTGQSNESQYPTAAAEVDAKTKAIIAQDSKLSYSDAMDRLFTTEPDLKARYVAGQA